MIGLITGWLPKEEDDEVRVVHLLNGIGKDAQDLYETFTLIDKDRKDITKAFEANNIQKTNIIYERYMFNRSMCYVGVSYH